MPSRRYIEKCENNDLQRRREKKWGKVSGKKVA
jgi:hypothetical protein